LLFSAHRYRDLGAEQHEFPDDVDLRNRLREPAAERRGQLGAPDRAEKRGILTSLVHMGELEAGIRSWAVYERPALLKSCDLSCSFKGGAGILGRPEAGEET
jgi:hypothetical protein